MYSAQSSALNLAPFITQRAHKQLQLATRPPGTKGPPVRFDRPYLCFALVRKIKTLHPCRLSFRCSYTIPVSPSTLSASFAHSACLSLIPPKMKYVLNPFQFFDLFSLIVMRYLPPPPLIKKSVSYTSRFDPPLRFLCAQVPDGRQGPTVYLATTWP
jgi:hypothetical protein